MFWNRKSHRNETAVGGLCPRSTLVAVFVSIVGKTQIPTGTRVKAGSTTPPAMDSSRRRGDSRTALRRSRSPVAFTNHAPLCGPATRLRHFAAWGFGSTDALPRRFAPGVGGRRGFFTEETMAHEQKQAELGEWDSVSAAMVQLQNAVEAHNRFGAGYLAEIEEVRGRMAAGEPIHQIRDDLDYRENQSAAS